MLLFDPIHDTFSLQATLEFSMTAMDSTALGY